MDANKVLEALNELENTLTADAVDHGVQPSVVENEPVVIAHVVTTVLTGLVAWGWVAIPVPAINLIASLVVLAVIAGIAVAARNKVTPAAKWEDSIKELATDVVKAELAELAKVTTGK